MFAWTASRTGVQLPSPPAFWASVVYAITRSQVGTSIRIRPAKSADVYRCARWGFCCFSPRERIFGNFSHRNLRFGENQVWRFALSTRSFEVEKEKWGLFLDSEGGSVFVNEERPAPVRNRFSTTLSRSEGGRSEKETKVRSNCAASFSWRRS